MHCADPAPKTRPRWGVALVLTLTAAAVVGCGSFSKSKPSSTRSSGTPTAPGSTKGSTTTGTVLKPESTLRLGPPGTPRSWDQVREQAAQRLIAANPNITYTGRAPDVLLAIPVLSIQLNGDGSIKYIDVMRYPHQARDTIEVAKAALYRAEPFGDVSHLPKPWRFTETFLFNEQRKFKPLTLDR